MRTPPLLPTWWQSEVMDYIPHFRRETLAFDAAVRRVPGADGAPMVPSCPDWSVSDLVAHLGVVHRYGAASSPNGFRRRPTPRTAPSTGSPRI